MGPCYPPPGPFDKGKTPDRRGIAKSEEHKAESRKPSPKKRQETLEPLLCSALCFSFSALCSWLS